MKRFLLVLAFVLFSRTAFASNCSATTQAELITCVTTTASSGETVTIANSLTLTSTITITKGITITGAGSCTLDANGRPTSCPVILTSNLASDIHLFDITTEARQTTRITNLEIKGFNNLDSSYPNKVFHVIGCNTSTGIPSLQQQIRLDHLYVHDIDRSVFDIDTAVGVIDHNNIDTTAVTANNGIVIHFAGTYYDTCTHGLGHESMNAAIAAGSNQSMYVEDNLFTSNLFVAVTDCEFGGARFVFRFNTVNKGDAQCHGFEVAANRGQRLWEIYGNTFYGNGVSSNGTYMRGGAGYVFNNYFPSFGFGVNLNLIDNAGLQNIPAVYGGNNGRNPWHGAATTGIATGTCNSVGGSLGVRTCTVSPSPSWTAHTFDGKIMNRTTLNSGVSITSASRSSDTITFTSSGAHGFRSGIAVFVYNLSGGTGYSDGTAVATTGGAGSGLTVDITTSGGIVQTVTINYGGSDYVDTNTITISGGGGNATFQIFVTGDIVGCWGATADTHYGYNNIFGPITVTDSTHFTASAYAIEINASMATSDTYRCAIGGSWAFILDNTADTITYTNSVNTPSYDMVLVAGDGFEVNTPGATMDSVCRGDGGSLLSTGYPALPGGWAPIVEGCYEWINTTDQPTFQNGYTHMTSGFAYACNGDNSLCSYPSVRENTEFFNYAIGSDFDGTLFCPTAPRCGIGSGTRANRPSSSVNGFAWWATDQAEWDSTHAGNDGCLDRVVGGVWVDCFYTPYNFPHPLVADTDYLSFSQQPTNVTSGDNFSPTITVTVNLPGGGADTSATGTITLTISGCGATLTGDNTVDPTNGVATFTGLGATGSGTSCTLSAAISGGTTALPAVSNSFNVAGEYLAFTQQPGDITSGQNFSPTIIVTVHLAGGTTDTGATGTITLTLNGCGTSITGDPTIDPVNGVSTFTGLGVLGAATGCIMQAVISGGTTATNVYSNVFTVTAEGPPPITATTITGSPARARMAPRRR